MKILKQKKNDRYLKKGEKPEIVGGIASNIKDRELIETLPQAKDFSDIREYRKAKEEYAETGTYTKFGLPEKELVAGVAGVGTIPKLTDIDEANEFLNQKQSEFFQDETRKTAPPTKTKINKLISKQKVLEPPKFSSLAEQYRKLREEKGVESLEDELNLIKSDEESLKAEFRDIVDREEGALASMGVIAGRIGQREKDYRRRLDFINRQKTVAVNQLQTKYGVIEQIMSFTKSDFETSQRQYQNEFSRNLQMINLFRQEDQAERMMKKDEDIVKDRQIDNARANLQVYNNLITQGGLAFSDLTDEQKLVINKLETQAGMPLDSLSLIRSKYPDTDILSHNARTDQGGNKYIDFVMRDKSTGALKVENMFVGSEKRNVKFDIISQKTRQDPTGQTYLDIVTRDPNDPENIQLKTIELGMGKTSGAKGYNGIYNMDSLEAKSGQEWLELQHKSIGKKGGECGYFGNNYTEKLGMGRIFADSTESKTKYINVSIDDFLQNPVDGALAVYDIRTGPNATNGHVGIVRRNAKGQMFINDSNSDGISQKIDFRPMNLSKGLEKSIVGFFVPDKLKGGIDIPSPSVKKEQEIVDEDLIKIAIKRLKKDEDASLGNLGLSRDEKAEIAKRMEKEKLEEEKLEKALRSADTGYKVGVGKIEDIEDEWSLDLGKFD